MKTMIWAVALPFAVACGSPASAASVLGPELESFAVLGGSTVANTGPSSLVGNLGVSAGTAITGFYTTAENDGPGTFTGAAHQADAFAGSAQTQLILAKTSLGLAGPMTALGADLNGLVLAPGFYSVLAGASNLTGLLTLDGLGNANAYWVFQLDSTLITTADSVVDVINTGANAGVFWNVGSSATLGAGTSFQGNILASASIALGAGATMGCGGAYAHTGAVTMNDNTVAGGCTGGLTVAELGDLATPLPFAPITTAVPEPETYAMLLAGLGLLAFAARRRQRDAA